MQTYTLTTKFNWQRTYQDLAYTFRQWEIESWNVSEPKRKSLNDWSVTEEERTVTVRFELRGRPIILTMGKQARAVDNFRVLYKAIEDMRMQERRGISEVIQNAYLQIGAPIQEKNPYDVLGLPRGTAIVVCEAQFRELAKDAHPDRGGSQDRMKELTDAINKIRKGEA